MAQLPASKDDQEKMKNNSSQARDKQASRPTPTIGGMTQPQKLERSQQARTTAQRVAVVLLACSAMALPFFYFLAAKSDDWQLTALLYINIPFFVASAVGLWLIRRERIALGIGLMLAVMGLVVMAASVLLSGIGIIAGLGFPLLAFYVASRTMTGREAAWIDIFSVVVGIVSIIASSFVQSTQIPIPAVEVAVPVMAVILIVLAGITLYRQFPSYPLRTKLVIILVGVSLFSISAVAFATNQVISGQIQQQVGANLSTTAKGKALEIGAILERSKNTLESLALNEDLANEVKAANTDGSPSIPELMRLDQEWQSAPDNTDPLIQKVLNNAFSGELREYQGRFPEYVEIFVTDKYGRSIASTNRTSDYLQADEPWWQAAWNRGKGSIFISQPQYDLSAGRFAVDVAVPILNENHSAVIGILRATVDVTSLKDALFAGKFGRTGSVDLVFPSQQYLHGDPNAQILTLDSESVGQLFQLKDSYGSFNYEARPRLVSKQLVSTNNAKDRQEIENLGWYVVTHQDTAEAMAPAAVIVRTIVLTALAILLLASALAFYLGNTLTRPLNLLTSAATRVAEGNLTVQAPVTSQDEIGTLASTFNGMTAQLHNLIGSMEQRVAERTRDLELASEVGRAVSEKVSDLQNLLSEAAELIRDRFDLYYTQIYLAEPDGRTLKLRAGTGDVGAMLLQRGHHLLIGSGSINGRAASNKQALIVSDTALNPAFLPNPLLPNTRSEMAVPLLAGERVVGVLDMQSERPGALSEAELSAFEALAAQLAVAIQNATLFAEVQQSRMEVEAQARRLTRTGWQEFLDAVERSEQLGYVFDQEQVIPLESAGSLNGQPTLNVPIMITGEQMGLLQIVGETDQVSATETVQIARSTASLLANQIENLRLFSQAERYRAEAEESARRLTREGWESYLRTRQALADGYVYDLNAVQPVSMRANGKGVPEFARPVVIRDTVIGELAVDHVSGRDEEAAQIVAAVAEQLSGHIENLRLLEEAEQRRIEIEQGEARLAEAIDLAKLGHWQYDPADDLFIFNDHFYSLLHTTAEQEGGYTMSSMEYAGRFVYPEDIPVVGSEIGKALATTERLFQTNLESRVIYKDGGVGYITVSVNVERDEHGNITRFYGANQDITERKNAELALREGEARLAEALDIAKLAHWEYDTAKDIFTFNDHFFSIFHTTVAQEGGYQLSSADYATRFVHPEDMPLVGGEIAKALAATERLYNVKLEHRVHYRDGGMGYISVNVNVERDEQGNITRFYGANQDITERKNAELALRESEQRYQQILDAITDMVLVKGEKSRIVWANKSFRDYYGMTNEQLRDMIDAPTVEPDYTLQYIKDDAYVYETGNILSIPEEPVTRFDGAVYPFETVKAPIRDINGKVVMTVGVSRDISERKANQEIMQQRARELEETQSFLDSVIENLPTMLFVKDAENLRFVRWNKAEEELVGYKREDIIGKGDYDLFPKADADYFVAKDRHVLESGQMLDIPEESLVTARKGIRILHTRKVPIYGSDGKAKYLLGVSEDITERKQSEEIIRQAHQRAQLILETVTLPMVITRLADNHLTFVNQPALEVTQFEYDQVINQPAPDFYYNPEERARFVMELRTKGVVTNLVVQLRRRDGEPFWAMLSARTFDYQGEASILTTFTDITDRIHAQEALARRATELATVAQVSTTASTVLDPDKLLQTVVDVAKERFGLYHAHVYLLNESWNTLLLASGAGEIGRQLVAEEHSIPLDAEQSLVARAARSADVIIVNDVRSEPGFLANPLLPGTQAEMAVPMIVGGRVLGVFDVQSNQPQGFSAEDANIYTTLAAQVAVALQNARLYVEQSATVTQLRELDRLKSSFLANMSHELRTPLNSILGFADVILEGLDGPLTVNMDSDLRLIQKNGQHLLHLINDVLDMAKIEAGRMNLNPEKFRVYEVLDEVTSITSTLASEKNLALFIEECSDREVQVYADHTRLRQVMINLVNNAIKFTEKGKIALKVEPMEGARVLITVKDTGIGIPPDKLEAVFQEFTQVDTSSTRKAGGTGLGLPISRRLVEMHGGRLWVESTGVNGKGSVFFVELPVEARITEVIEKTTK